MSVGALWPLSRRSKRSRILLIDDVFPDARIGGDVPRTAELLRALIAADGQVTVLSTRDHSVEDARGIATLRLQEGEDLGHLLSTRHETFAVIIVARPHNMAQVAAVMRRDAVPPG